MLKNKKISGPALKSKAGFTLVELLVVIAIIGILASVVLVSLNSARGKARDARRISDLHQVSLALENYYDANGAYPSALTGLTAPPSPQSPYIASEPKDPTGTGVYIYTYDSSGCTPTLQKYVIKGVLENHPAALDSDADGTQCGITTCGTQGSTEREYCVVP